MCISFFDLLIEKKINFSKTFCRQCRYSDRHEKDTALIKQFVGIQQIKMVYFIWIDFI